MPICGIPTASAVDVGRVRVQEHTSKLGRTPNPAMQCILTLERLEQRRAPNRAVFGQLRPQQMAESSIKPQWTHIHRDNAIVTVLRTEVVDRDGHLFTP